MKGMSPIISMVLTIMISTFAITLVITTLKPTFEKTKSYNVFNEAMQNLELIRSTIKEVSSEAEGSKRTIYITVSDGTYRVDTEKEIVYFDYEPSYDLGFFGRSGNVWVERGLLYGEWFDEYTDGSTPTDWYVLSGNCETEDGRFYCENGISFYNYTKNVRSMSVSVEMENENGLGEVFVLPVTPENLTLFLPFDESSGNTSYDYSGNGRNGSSLDGNTTNDDGDTPPSRGNGKYGNGLVFDGSDDYVKVSAFPVFDNSSFTIIIWSKLENVGRTQGLLHKGKPFESNNALHITVASNGYIKFGFYGDDLNSPNGVYQFGQWNFLAFTYDAETKEQKIYRNDALVASRTANGDLKGTDDDDLEIGRVFYRNSEAADGVIDEIKIYNRTLSENEIKAEYELGVLKLKESGTTDYARREHTPYVVFSNPCGKTYIDALRINEDYKKIKMVVSFMDADLNGTMRIPKGSYQVVVENMGLNSSANKPIIQLSAD